ncbi:MAG TPA: CHASE2 domain-containing protein, partial [Magnetococcales bacterium]|nr:CHASE2 domain-containing protein [Magnetococcales bacterium]
MYANHVSPSRSNVVAWLVKIISSPWLLGKGYRKVSIVRSYAMVYHGSFSLLNADPWRCCRSHLENQSFKLPWIAVIHFFSNRWFLISILTAAFLLADGAALLRPLEMVTYDWGVQMSQHPGDKRIVAIVVDDKSLAALGSWPWDGRHELQLIRTLVHGNPKLIVDTRVATFKRDKPSLEILSQARKKLESIRYRTQTHAASENPGFIKSMSELEEILTDGVKQLGVTREYVKIMGLAGNMIFAMEGVDFQ